MRVLIVLLFLVLCSCHNDPKKQQTPPKGGRKNNRIKIEKALDIFNSINDKVDFTKESMPSQLFGEEHFYISQIYERQLRIALKVVYNVDKVTHVENPSYVQEIIVYLEVPFDKREEYKPQIDRAVHRYMQLFLEHALPDGKDIFQKLWIET